MFFFSPRRLFLLLWKNSIYLFQHNTLHTWHSVKLVWDVHLRVQLPVTHHFKVARSNNQVVNDVIDLCDQGQDGRLKTGREQQTRFLSVKVNSTLRVVNQIWQNSMDQSDGPALQVWGSGPGSSSEDTRWTPSRRARASLWGRPSHTYNKQTEGLRSRTTGQWLYYQPAHSSTVVFTFIKGGVVS